MIKDATGRQVPLVPLEWGCPGTEGAARQARVTKAAQNVKMQMPPSHVLKSVAYLAPVVILISCVPAAMSFWWRAPWWVTIAAAIPIGVVPSIVTILVLRHIGAAQIAEALCLASLCASCGYELTGTPPDPDGITKCPECGADWRLPEDRSGLV